MGLAQGTTKSCKWCRAKDVVFRQITSFLIGDYLEHHLLDQDGHPLAAPSKKQHLAALRHFFANQQLYHGVVLNPAASVRGPKHVAHEGKTPAFAKEQVKHLFRSIDTANIVGLRDKTLLMVLTYTAARAGAVAKLKIGDYYSDGAQWWFHFGEKGTFSCHSFRTTTATDLLKHEVPREQVQYLLGHSDARTTDLYNRTDKEVSRNIVERISI